jgi:pectinesterase
MITLYLKPSDDIMTTLDQIDLFEKVNLYLEPGIYYQKLKIKHHHLKIYGSLTEESVITYDDYSYKMHQDGLLYNTFRTETVMILGNHVELHHLTIRNSSGSHFTIGQAVALAIYGSKVILNNIKIIGNQDSLFLGPLPVDLTNRYDGFLNKDLLHTNQTHTLIISSYIEGDVDFIFGSGTAYFYQTKIVSKARGYMLAPSTYQEFSYGFIFNDCDFINLSNDEVYIARPWREYGTITIYQSRFQGLFNTKRFDKWDKVNIRFHEQPYIDNEISKPLLKEEVEQLKQYVLKYFNCSIK